MTDTLDKDILYADYLNKWFVRKAVKEDMKVLIEEMSPENAEEIWMAHNLTPKEAIEMAFEDSIKAYTIDFKGKPVGVFGIRNSCGFNAEIYLLVTTGFQEIGTLFLRHAREIIDYFLKIYPYLDGWVYTKNEKSIFWMRYCKATIEHPMIYGAEKKLFSHFFFI